MNNIARHILFILFATLFSWQASLSPLWAQDAGNIEEENEEDEYHPYRRDEPMVFYLAKDFGSFFTHYWIAAQGKITKETPKTFEDFLRKDPEYRAAVKDVAAYEKKLRDPKYRRDVEEGIILPYIAEFGELHLHSCGGDEEAAMKLGQLFRKHDLSAVVSQTYALDPESPAGSYTEDIGECQGACPLVLLEEPTIWRTDDPKFSSEKEYERLRKVDDGEGHLQNKAYLSYHPIILGPFQTPLPKIIAYAKAKGASPRWLRELLPSRQDESRKLNYWQAHKLGIGQEASNGYYIPPPDEQQSCAQ